MTPPTTAAQLAELDAIYAELAEQYRAEDQALLDRAQAAAAAARTALEAALPGKERKYERQVAMGRLFASYDHNPQELASHDLNCALESYVGAKLAAQVEQLLAVHAQLMGYHPANRLDLGGTDNYGFGLFDGIVKPDLAEEKVLDAIHAADDPDHVPGLHKRWRLKVFGKERQSFSYLVALRESYRGWEVHIRQFWPDVLAKQAAGHSIMLDGLDRQLKAGTATLADVLKASYGLNHYADTAAHSPCRLGLTPYLASGFAIDHPESCAGLRYADARDTGYVASVTHSSLHGWVCDAPMVNWGLLRAVLYDLAATSDCLAEQ